MKSLIFFLFLVSIFSCKCPEKLESTKDITTNEIIRDTIIKINEKSDTFYVYLPKIINGDQIEIKKKSTSLVVKKKTESSLMVVCNEDELKLKLDSVIRLKSTTIKEKVVFKIEKCNNKLHLFSLYFFLISLFFLVLLLLIRFK